MSDVYQSYELLRWGEHNGEKTMRVRVCACVWMYVIVWSEWWLERCILCGMKAIGLDLCGMKYCIG